MNIAKFSKENSSFWLRIIQEIFINEKKIVIKARPSKEKALKMAEEKSIKLEKQKKSYEQNRSLIKNQSAIEGNQSMMDYFDATALSDLDIDNYNNIMFWPIHSYNRTFNRNNVFDFKNIPYRLHIADIKSDFVYIYIYQSFQKELEMKNPICSTSWFQ